MALQMKSIPFQYTLSGIVFHSHPGLVRSPESLWLPYLNLTLRYGAETDLVLFSQIWPLPYLNDLAFFQHLETVPTECQQNDVSSFKNGAFQILLVHTVKVHSYATGF